MTQSCRLPAGRAESVWFTRSSSVGRSDELQRHTEVTAAVASNKGVPFFLANPSSNGCFCSQSWPNVNFGVAQRATLDNTKLAVLLRFWAHFVGNDKSSTERKGKCICQKAMEVDDRLSANLHVNRQEFRAAAIAVDGACSCSERCISTKEPKAVHDDNKRKCTAAESFGAVASSTLSRTRVNRDIMTADETSVVEIGKSLCAGNFVSNVDNDEATASTGQQLLTCESMIDSCANLLSIGCDGNVACQASHDNDTTEFDASDRDRGGPIIVENVGSPDASVTEQTDDASVRNNNNLPDILNSHRPPEPPPYTPPSQPFTRSQGRYSSWVREGPERWLSYSRADMTPPCVTTSSVDHCCTKDCCLSCLTMVTTFRWILVSLAALGICCVIVGIVLGILHISDPTSGYLTLSLMFIGLGIMMVVVVVIGWRCTPGGHEPCHLLLSLGEHSRQPDGHYYNHSRSQWHAGLLYPEFRYRRPPPSYNIAMLQQQPCNARRHPLSYITPIRQQPPSPPPAYRSRTNTLRSTRNSTFPRLFHSGIPSSRPPTYRSHASSRTIDNCRRPAVPLDLTMQGYDNPACDEVTVVVHANELDQCSVDINSEHDSDKSSRISPVERVAQYLESLLQDEIGIVTAEPVIESSTSVEEENIPKEEYSNSESTVEQTELTIPLTSDSILCQSSDIQHSVLISQDKLPGDVENSDLKETSDDAEANKTESLGMMENEENQEVGQTSEQSLKIDNSRRDNSELSHSGSSNVTYIIQIQLPNVLNNVSDITRL